MYHTPEDHSTSTDNVADSAALLGNVEPEIYATFLNFQESLMRPYTSPGGKFADNVYEKMLPIAAQLTSAAATLASAELASLSNNVDEKSHD